MTCPQCGHRKARRQCPALGGQICTVCCGTKRLVEIVCPDSCAYLASARRHPPSAVVRQQAHDFGLLVPTLRDLTEPQQQAYFLMATMIVGLPEDPLQRLRDADVVEAAAALAGTLETAARGVIYEQQPQSVPARRLAAEFRRVLEALQAELPGRQAERDVTQALRALERGAREIPQESGSGPTAYIDLLRRTLPAPGRSTDTAPAGDAQPAPAGLIIPPYS